MAQESEHQLAALLETFAEENRKLMALGRQILPMLDDERTRHVVDKPLLLKLILEKYVELIDEKLLPAVSHGNQAAAPKAPVAAASPSPSEPRPHEPTDPSFHLSKPKIVEDFRGTDPRYRPIQRPTGQVERFRSPNAVAANAEPAARPAAAHPQPVTVGVPHEPRGVVSVPQTPKSSHACLHISPESLIENPAGSKRSIPRYNCRVPLSYAVKGQDKNLQRAYTKDVGALGLFILANRPEKTGNLIEIEVELPDNKLATLQGVVRWTKWVPQNLRSVEMPGFGVKITSAPEAWYSFFMKAPTREPARMTS